MPDSHCHWKRAQNSLEFAMLIGLVAASFVLMIGYVRGAAFAKLKHLEMQVNDAMDWGYLEDRDVVIINSIWGLKLCKKNKITGEITCKTYSGSGDTCFETAFVLPGKYVADVRAGREITMSTDEWERISGRSLSPGNYFYHIVFAGEEKCCDWNPCDKACRRRDCSSRNLLLVLT